MRRPGAGNLVAAPQAAAFEPAQVDVVVITHMHGDHIGGLMADGAPTCPNARCVRPNQLSTGSTIAAMLACAHCASPPPGC